MIELRLPTRWQNIVRHVKAMENTVKTAMNRVRRLAAKIGNAAQNVRTTGLRQSVELYTLRAYETYRDWKLGIRTMGFVQARQLGLGPDCIDYEPINYRFLDAVFGSVRTSHRDVFLDYGCGKGRVLIAAAQHPMRRVVGVELSAELSSIARRNVEQASKHLQCKEIEVATADATTFVLPYDVSIIFLFNPFTGSVLEAVIQRIAESLVRSPRRIRIIYARPPHVENQFDACDWLTTRTKLSTPEWNKVDVLVYETSVEQLQNRESVELLVN